MDYIAYLHKDSNSDFGVSFPDFPGCVTAGKTLLEAQRLAGEALTLHIAGMAEDGDAIPVPLTLDELIDDPLREGVVATLVRVGEQGDKAVRINITAKESQVDKIDELAKNAGLSRSAYMVRSSLARIRLAEQARITRLHKTLRTNVRSVISNRRLSARTIVL